jgi:hypothetical protein
MPRSADFEAKTTFKTVDKSTRVVGKIQSKIMRFTSKVAMGMRKVNRAVSKVTGAVTRGLKYGFATATVAATGLFFAINRTAESMDALAKKTRAINFPIEEFQEWRFVAEQSGVSQGIFDKSLTKFTKTVGELKGGYGAMFTALKKTNRPLLRQLKTTDNVADAFDLYLKAIHETPNAMDKAALATAAFGRSGVDMINVANNSAKEIEKLRYQMRENGIVTAEQAAKAEAYNDMMNRVKYTVSGFMVDVLSPLMPLMTEGVNIARKWAVANRDIISSKLKSGLSWLVDNFDKIIDYGKKIAIGIGVFYGIATAVKVASTAMTIFNAIAAMNPIALVVIATTAAVAAIIVFRKELIKITVNIIKKFQVMAAKVKDFFTNPKEYIVAAWKFIKSAVISIWESMWSKIKSVAEFAFDTLKDYVGVFIDLFTGNWEGAGNKLMRIWDRFKSVALDVLESIKEILDPILKGIKIAWNWRDNTYERSSVPKSVSASRGASSVAASVLPSVVRPSVSLAKTETVSTSNEQVEVTIKDETGRAKVTKGKSRNLRLLRTGAAPL